MYSGLVYLTPMLGVLLAAPCAINATMMGVVLLSVFAGNEIGDRWDTLSHVDFYLLHAGLAAGPLIVMVLIGRWATRIFAPRGMTP